MWRRYARNSLLALAGLLVVLAGLLTLIWQHRDNLDDIDWPEPSVASAVLTDTVTATWLGVSTLLFDDGETQILIDGFFSRPSLADIILDRPVDVEAASVNYAMNEFRMRRVAAIIPVHSHFDHAMDIGAIANRSSASIMGSQSTAQIARGAGVPEDQIIIVENSEAFEFGDFTVTLYPSPHAPVGWRGAVPLDGTIDEPLVPPQPVSAWRMGGAYTIYIEHPQGTALVQGSAGYRKYQLRNKPADVVFLGIAQLDSLGRNYAEVYWQHVVTATGAHSIYPIHFDDLTQPFGEVLLPPKFVDDTVNTARWLEEFRRRWDTDASLFMPSFGEPVAIFSQPSTSP